MRRINEGANRISLMMESAEASGSSSRSSMADENDEDDSWSSSASSSLSERMDNDNDDDNDDDNSFIGGSSTSSSINNAAEDGKFPATHATTTDVPPPTYHHPNNNNAVVVVTTTSGGIANAAVRRRMAPTSTRSLNGDYESDIDINITTTNNHDSQPQQRRDGKGHYHHKLSSGGILNNNVVNNNNNNTTIHNNNNNNNNNNTQPRGHRHHRHQHHHHHHPRSSKRLSSKHNTASSSFISKLGSVCCKRGHHLLVRHFPTLFLIGCFMFWLMVQTTNVYESVSESTHHQYSTTTSAEGDLYRGSNIRPYGSVGQRTARLAVRNNKKNKRLQPNNDNWQNNNGEENPPQPLQNNENGGGLAFLTDAVEGLVNLVGLPAKVYRQVSSRGEGLPPGCVRSDWQEFDLPNCNDMHETDLYQVFSGKVRRDGGYVGSGYWRDVWLVDPRFEAYSPVKHNINIENDNGHDNDGNNKEYTDKFYGAVLKMMKSEHKVETRNFERHRRDALAMERLTSSPNIVDIYAFCGNSVLTEYVGNDLHRVLYHQYDDDEDMTISTKKIALPRTGREKLELALEVTKGVAALHQVQGGPIVHADIADKQFLIDEHGHVKLNDFNRCRFMGHDEKTGEKCSFRIPSAPGRHRSPEEYEDTELTEQLDTYSTANVLYGILTGFAPWRELPSSQVKRAAKHGVKPPIDDKYRTPGTPEALLASLIDQAYEHDPEIRITAPDLMRELENALAAS